MFSIRCKFSVKTTRLVVNENTALCVLCYDNTREKQSTLFGAISTCNQPLLLPCTQQITYITGSGDGQKDSVTTRSVFSKVSTDTTGAELAAKFGVSGL